MSFGARASSYAPPAGGTFVASDYGTVFGEWDFSDTATITDSAGAVSAVTDKSGNGRTMSQGTAANRPTTGAATIGGLNALTFDGTNDTIATGIVNLAQPFTFAIVGKSASATPGSRRLAGTSTLIGTSAGNLWFMSAGTNILGGAVNATPHLFVCRFNSTSSELRMDGANVASGNAGTGGYVATAISAGAAGGGNYWNGQIGHFIVYTAVTDLAGLETALMTKWSL